MIKLFNSTEKEFITNGEVVIDAAKARVICKDNSDFYLDLNCGIEYSAYMTMGNILVVPTPQGEQPFRIRSVSKNKTKLTVKAWHIYYDAQNYIIKDKYSVNETCEEALTRFNSSTDIKSPFTVSSDITDTNSFRCVRKQLAEAVDTVAERWGGHIKRDKWSIAVNKSIGTDNGITIEYAKNLQELTADYDFSSVVTKLLPVGANGILLTNVYVYSDIQYSTPYTKVVSFSQSISEDGYKDRDGNLVKEAYNEALRKDLLKQAQDYLKTYSLPKINYTLKGTPEKVTDIGDVIKVKDERIGVDVTTEVIAYEYDAIREKYVSLEFGNFTNTLSGLVSAISSSTSSNVSNAVTNLTTELSEAMSSVKSNIFNTMTSSYVLYDTNQILVVDTLPKEYANNVIKIDRYGISISNTGVNGLYRLIWTIDGKFDASNIDLINFTADIIKGGILTLNSTDAIEIYDTSNALVSEISADGFIFYTYDGRFEVSTDGFRIYDKQNQIVLLMQDGMLISNKLAVENEFRIGNFKAVTMEISDNNTVTNIGVGLIPI